MPKHVNQLFYIVIVRPDIFNLSSFKNPNRIFQEMEKKIIKI